LFSLHGLTIQIFSITRTAQKKVIGHSSLMVKTVISLLSV